MNYSIKKNKMNYSMKMYTYNIKILTRMTYEVIVYFFGEQHTPMF